MKPHDSFAQFGIIDAQALENVNAIVKFIPHPEYDGREGHTTNDIAILEVSKNDQRGPYFFVSSLFIF